MGEKRQYKQTCSATNRQGGPCGRPVVPGLSVCRYHGGSTKASRAAAARRLEAQKAERTAATYGLPVEVDPLSALLQELWRTAGHVAWLGALIADLDDVGAEGRDERGRVVERPSVWIQLYQQERAHLAKVAKDCLTVGIEERRVRLAEDQARAVAEAMRAFAVAVGLDPAEESVRAAMRNSLTAVAAHAA